MGSLSLCSFPDAFSVWVELVSCFETVEVLLSRLIRSRWHFFANARRICLTWYYRCMQRVLFQLSVRRCIRVNVFKSCDRIQPSDAFEVLLVQFQCQVTSTFDDLHLLVCEGHPVLIPD